MNRKLLGISLLVFCSCIPRSTFAKAIQVESEPSAYTFCAGTFFSEERTDTGSRRKAIRHMIREWWSGVYFGATGSDRLLESARTFKEYLIANEHADSSISVVCGGSSIGAYLKESKAMQVRNSYKKGEQERCKCEILDVNWPPGSKTVVEPSVPQATPTAQPAPPKEPQPKRTPPKRDNPTSFSDEMRKTHEENSRLNQESMAAIGAASEEKLHAVRMKRCATSTARRYPDQESSDYRREYDACVARVNANEAKQRQK